MSKRGWENLLLLSGMLAALVLTGILVLRPSASLPESPLLPSHQGNVPPLLSGQAQRIPPVSSSQPFGYSVKQLTLTNCAEQPQQLKARARLLLYAYLKPGTAVSTVIARLPEYSCQSRLADDGKNDGGIRGDGVWSGYLDTPELPVATDIVLKLETRIIGSKLPLVTECKIKLAAPEVYPIRFWREPAGAIKPGAKVTFYTEFNQEAVLAEINASISKEHLVHIHFRASSGWELDEGLRAKVYLGDWV